MFSFSRLYSLLVTALLVALIYFYPEPFPAQFEIQKPQSLSVKVGEVDLLVNQARASEARQETNASALVIGQAKDHTAQRRDFSKDACAGRFHNEAEQAVREYEQHFPLSSEERERLYQRYHRESQLGWANLSPGDFYRESEKLEKVDEILGAERAQAFATMRHETIDKSIKRSKEMEAEYFAQRLNLTSEQQEKLFEALNEPDLSLNAELAFLKKRLNLSETKTQELRAIFKQADEIIYPDPSLTVDTQPDTEPAPQLQDRDVLIANMLKMELSAEQYEEFLKYQVEQKMIYPW